MSTEREFAQSPAKARITIADIARRAGVSSGAVSYALNGVPKVSAETRDRILKIAEDLGWYPNRAARALSGSRVGACGLVLARPPSVLSLGSFFMELIGGIEGELSKYGVALTLQIVDSVAAEVAVYGRWWAEHRVDGILIVDLRVSDPRPDEVIRLGMPAVALGGSGRLDRPGLPCMWHDEAAAVWAAVGHLAALGHRRVARVAGPTEMLYTKMRTAAFRTSVKALGLEASVVTGGSTIESGAEATQQLLRRARRPTAIVYDGELLAIAGLGAARQQGLNIPGDLSIVVWDDSLLCQVVFPPFTAIRRDVHGSGARAAAQLLRLIDEGGASGAAEPPAELIERASTGPPPPLPV